MEILVEPNFTKPSSPVPCAHCGAPSAPSSTGVTFCCQGCKSVYESIHALGLTHFYDYRNLNLKSSARVNPKERSYAWLDESSLLDEISVTLPDGVVNATLKIEGIFCAGCLWILETLPQVHDGLLVARSNLSTGILSVVYDSKKTTLSAIARLLDSLGFPTHPDTGDAPNNQKSNSLLLRLGVAAFCALNTMMFAVSLFQGFFTGITHAHAELFRWASFLISLPSVFYSASPIYKNSLLALRVKKFHIDQPIAIAIITGFSLSVMNTILSRPFVYFDSVCALIFLLLIGRVLQDRALEKARSLTQKSWEILPEIAIVDRDGSKKEVLVTNIKKGELVFVKPLERIPVDGVVVDGTTEIDVSVMTGESTPVVVNKGDSIHAGALNILSEISLRSTSLGTHSRISKLLKELKDNSLSKPLSDSLTEKTSKYFVLVTGTLSLFTLFYWLFFDISIAIESALAVLIVSCPCAVGIAIPLCYGVNISRASEKGILIKSAHIFSALRNIKTIFFDKTGTLTSDTLTVVDTWLSNENEIPTLTTSLASLTPHHPTSRALIKFFGDQHSIINEKKVFQGKGISGKNDLGEEIYLGSSAWAIEKGVLDRKNSFIIEAFKRGDSISVLFNEKSLIALFAVRASLKPESKSLINELKEKGKEINIISGDIEASVAHLAHSLNIKKYFSEKSPEDKASIVRESNGGTLFVGDGINDALAIRAATVGVGVTGGLEANLEVSDVYLAKGDLKDLNSLFYLSDRMRVITLRIIAVSILYNGISATLAACGMMDPLIAAVVMPINSLTVIGIAIFSKALR